jgi:tetratricopeptide (TPR) repeat protein
VRRLLRRISVLHANAALYLLIACISLVFWQELRWAAEHLPKYLHNSIGPLAERSSYGSGAELLAERRNLSVAREYLESSIAIDPYSEAVYALGEYFFETRQDEKALQQFRSYLDIDPGLLTAYLKMSAVFERQGRLPEARRIVERGLEYFSTNVEKYRPHYADEVDARYNQKAARIFARYGTAVGTLRREVERIEDKERSSARVVAHE